MNAERRAKNAGQQAERLTTAGRNSRRPRFVVGGMDAKTANDHILAEGLIDDDALVPFGETTFTILSGKGRDGLAGHP
ncbi:hypothetical protein ACYSM9_09590 [Arthrobacter sp. C152]